MDMSESAVIVPVPEAEPVVGEFRASLDRSAGWGVPAHVTVIYPFLAPDRLGLDELRRLRDAVRSVPRFDVSFPEVRWFADTVVWLAPHPADGFRALIDAVWSAFPECPPYGGAFDTPVPHLTIGDDAALDALSAAGDAVSRRLPVTASVQVAHLFQGSATPGAWRSVAELPLG
ncbi:2'-5' RNA ligase family protein [Pseudonocardia yunnanensis]